MTTYTATAPNGETISRRSARPFTHAVVLTGKAGGFWEGSTRASFAASRDLAEKAAGVTPKVAAMWNVTIVAVEAAR